MKNPQELRRPAAGQRTTVAIVTVVLMFAAVIAGSSVDLAAQCAMCRTVLNSPEGQRIAGALRHGILLLLAAPFAVFAVIAILAIRGQRRRLHLDGTPR